MSDRDKSKEQLIEELASLRREVAQLRVTKTVFDAEQELFHALVTLWQTAKGSLMLKGVLQQVLKVTRQLTHAEDGSLFLLDAEGVVVESILARGATIRGQKQRLLGQVLDKGLAGWVGRHHQIGLIADTQEDERWLTLPYQPYQVRSAIAVPLLKGKTLVGILTLMHSQPGHFTRRSVYVMERIATAMALILDNVQLYSKYQPLGTLHPTKPSARETVNASQDLQARAAEFSEIGIYIIFKEGNFLYANPRLAEIFGYTFGELVSLESILDLVAVAHRKSVFQQLDRCLQGYSKNLSCKFMGQRKDGNLVNVEIYGTRTKLYGKSVAIGALRMQ
jgi:PAS domain S-box-containing protein